MSSYSVRLVTPAKEGIWQSHIPRLSASFETGALLRMRNLPYAIKNAPHGGEPAKQPSRGRIAPVRGSALCRGAEQALEFDELAGGCVGYRPEAEIALFPVSDIIASAGQGFAMVGRRGRQDEQVDHMFAAFVDEGRDWFAGDQVEPAADQREAFGAQVDGRRRQSRPAGQPGLDRVLIRGRDIGQMAA